MRYTIIPTTATIITTALISALRLSEAVVAAQNNFYWFFPSICWLYYFFTYINISLFTMLLCCCFCIVLWPYFYVAGNICTLIVQVINSKYAGCARAQHLAVSAMRQCDANYYVAVVSSKLLLWKCMYRSQKKVNTKNYIFFVRLLECNLSAVDNWLLWIFSYEYDAYLNKKLFWKKSLLGWICWIKIFSSSSSCITLVKGIRKIH